MELLVISRSQTTSFSPPPPPPATSNILRLYWGPSYDQKYIYFPFPFFPIIMLRGKGSIKPVHSNSWDRVGTVVAMAGKWQRLPAVLSRWNGAQRAEGHLKSSGITLRCVTTLGSDGDPCEVTVLEGVLLGLDWHFVEQAGICFGWPLGRKSSSHPWYSKTRAPSLFEGAEWRKPFLLQQWTGLIRFPRNAIAWMYDLNSVASHIATAKKAKQMHWFRTLPSHSLVFITSPAGKPYEDAAFHSLTLKTQSVCLCAIRACVCEHRGFSPGSDKHMCATAWLHNTTPTVLSW